MGAPQTGFKIAEGYWIGRGLEAIATALSGKEGYSVRAGTGLKKRKEICLDIASPNYRGSSARKFILIPNNSFS